MTTKQWQQSFALPHLSLGCPLPYCSLAIPFPAPGTGSANSASKDPFLLHLRSDINSVASPDDANDSVLSRWSKNSGNQRRIILDYSRHQHVTGETMELLFDLADRMGLTERMNEMRCGMNIISRNDGQSCITCCGCRGLTTLKRGIRRFEKLARAEKREEKREKKKPKSSSSYSYHIRYQYQYHAMAWLCGRERAVATTILPWPPLHIYTSNPIIPSFAPIFETIWHIGGRVDGATICSCQIRSRNRWKQKWPISLPSP